MENNICEAASKQNNGSLSRLPRQVEDKIVFFSVVASKFSFRKKKILISLRYKQHSTSRSIVVDALLHLFFATLEIELNRF